MSGQLSQKRPFVLEGLGGNEPGLALRPLLQAHRRPLQGLAVEILEVLEGTARHEVGFDREKTALLARFSIRMSWGMAAEGKPVGFGKSFHLRNDHGVGAQAAQTRQVSVVDDTDPGRIAPVAQGQMQETLQMEAVEDGVELEIPALGVAQVKQA